MEGGARERWVKYTALRFEGQCARTGDATLPIDGRPSIALLAVDGEPLKRADAARCRSD